MKSWHFESRIENERKRGGEKKPTQSLKGRKKERKNESDRFFAHVVSKLTIIHEEGWELSWGWTSGSRGGPNRRIGLKAGGTSLVQRKGWKK